jgi:hypothetical protein
MEGVDFTLVVIVKGESGSEKTVQSILSATYMNPFAFYVTADNWNPDTDWCKMGKKARNAAAMMTIKKAVANLLGKKLRNHASLPPLRRRDSMHTTNAPDTAPRPCRL